MNDFDFEELDKAVSALASKTHEEHGVPTPAPLSPRPVSTAADRPTSSAPSQPAAPPIIERPVQVSAPAATSKHRLAETRPKARGSFMDIVPPAPRKPAPRVGVVVQPVSKAEDIVPEESPSQLETQSVSPESMATPSKPMPPKAVEPVRDGANTSKPDEVQWPDPIDLHDSPKMSPEEPQLESAPAQSDPELDLEAKKPETVESPSPFLAEAKVEKRPLGAFSNFKPTSPEPPAPTDRADELTPEEDGTFKEPEKAPLPPKKNDESKIAADDEAKPDVHGVAMMSIPQQYQTEPKATDKAPRPVFDTKEYHPPLIEAAVPEHRGGGGMWGKLFVALVALALLAAAGYFAYIYFFAQ